jgi:hypothetical protein
VSTCGSIREIAARKSRTSKLPATLWVSLLLIGAGGCPFVGLAYEDDMVANYAVWAVDALDDAAIVRKTTANGATNVVGPMVFAYGWNNDFILAKQHPVREWPKVDTGTTHWFIIEVGSGNVHGPLTERQYNELRQTIGVPPELTFTKKVAKRKGKPGKPGTAGASRGRGGPADERCVRGIFTSPGAHGAQRRCASRVATQGVILRILVDPAWPGI